MAEPAKRLATYADLLELGDVRAEVIEGVVEVAPSPSPRHQSVMAALAAELWGPFQRGRGGPGGWWLIPDVDVRFGEHDVFRPDLSGWRREEVPLFPGERPVTERPAWVCEGLSPGSAALDQGAKRMVYERAGVPWYWLVDPLNRTVQVLALRGDAYVVTRVVGDHGVARLEPFEAIELELDALFPPGA